MTIPIRHLFIIFGLLLVGVVLGYALDIPQLVKATAATLTGYGLGTIGFGVHALAKGGK